MERFLPDPSGDERSSWRETYVLCDLDGCESIPENPFEMQEKIQYLIRKEGYFGRLTFWIVAYEKSFPADLEDIYGEAGFILVNEGDKDVMVHKTLHNILFWALRSRQPGNLLLLTSGNKNFGQDKFASIRQSMQNKGFYVTEAPLESVTKVELPRADATCY